MIRAHTSRRGIALLAAVAIITPTLAAGQADPRKIQAPSTDTARAVLGAYADCLVRREPGKVDTFLAMSAFDPAFGPRGAEISTSGCLIGGRLRFNVMLLRGALFAAKYRRDFGRHAPTMMIGPMDLTPAGASATAPDGGAAIRFTIRAADCVALRDREGARALILSTAGSNLERDMIDRLSPSLSLCAPGLSMARAKEPIEAALAEVMYRRAAQVRVVAGGSK